MYVHLFKTMPKKAFGTNYPGSQSSLRNNSDLILTCDVISELIFELAQYLSVLSCPTRATLGIRIKISRVSDNFRTVNCCEVKTIWLKSETDSWSQAWAQSWSYLNHSRMWLAWPPWRQVWHQVNQVLNCVSLAGRWSEHQKINQRITYLFFKNKCTLH